MADFMCTVAIPTRALFQGRVYYADVPSVEGNYGVLPGHEMIVATNKNGGVLTLHLDEAGNEKKRFLLYEGASQVYNNVLSVLGRFGHDVDDIDVEDVRAKAERMRKHIEELESSNSEQDQAELETSKERLAWYEVQIDYVERHQ